MAWLLETFLLEGSRHLFSHADPYGVLLYTIVTCVLIGTIVPFLCLRKAFIAGSVNMFQIGFRSFRRTILLCSLTFIAGYSIVVSSNPFGGDRLECMNVFFLMLPTAIASVMVCWVLIGTHVQALVRSSGALISIPFGIVATAVLFGVTVLGHVPAIGRQNAVFWFLCAGILAALFFFSVRDVYAATLFVAFSLVFLMEGTIDLTYARTFVPSVYLSSLIAIAALAAVHLYFSRNFTTILIHEQK